MRFRSALPFRSLALAGMFVFATSCGDNMPSSSTLTKGALLVGGAAAGGYAASKLIPSNPIMAGVAGGVAGGALGYLLGGALVK